MIQIKPYFILFFVGLSLIVTTLQADTFYKVYDTKSALVQYEIKGSGDMTDNSSIQVEGSASLVFRDWGTMKLYKEKYIESTVGAAKHTKTLSKLTLEDYGTVYEVDFEKEKIEKRIDPLIREALRTGKDLSTQNSEELTTKGQKLGRISVLGYPCEEWKHNGKKICYYKGIPLQEEFSVLGITVTKRAVFFEMDKNISDDSFVLPTFEEDESKGYLLAENSGHATKNAKESNQMIMTAPISDDNLSLQDENDIRDELTTDLFHKQKDLLPILLVEMREARVCLENAENKIEANECLANVLKIKEKMSGEVDESCKVTLWIESAKEKKLDKIEEKILNMKRRMPCIRRSQNLDDLSACMQEELE